LQVTARGGGTPLKLVTKDGSPPLKINSSAKVIRLNADKLDGLDSASFLGATAQATDSDSVDGRDANTLIRIAFHASDELPDGDDGAAFNGGVGQALTVSIAAPTAGWLVITGNIDARNFAGTDAFTCELWVDGSAVTGTEMASQLDGSGATNRDEDCTTHGVQEVAAGPHAVTFRLASVDTTHDFHDGSMSALFVPFDGTGAVSSS